MGTVGEGMGRGGCVGGAGSVWALGSFIVRRALKAGSICPLDAIRTARMTELSMAGKASLRVASADGAGRGDRGARTGGDAGLASCTAGIGDGRGLAVSIVEEAGTEELCGIQSLVADVI